MAADSTDKSTGDIMLDGVLKMPYDMAMVDEISRLQYYGRAQQAIEMIADLQTELSAYQLAEEEPETMVDGVAFKGCPFCGEAPTVSTLGASVDIECCVSMSLQKSDVLTIEERDTFSKTTYKYSEAAESKAMEAAAGYWNQRPEKAKKHEHKPG